MATTFIVMCTRAGFAILYPEITSAPGWTASELVGAFALGALLYGPTTILIGIMVDRVGVRITLLMGALLVGAGLGLTTLGSADARWPVLLGWVIVAGPGSASIGFVPTTKLLSLRAGPSFGAAMGIVMGGQGVAPLFIGPVLQGLIDFGGWRFATALFAVTAALVLITLTLLIAPGPAHATRSTAPPFALRRSLPQPAFWLMACSFFAIGFLMLLPTHQVAYFRDVGLSPMTAAIAAGVVGVLTGAGALVGGWLTGRLGAPPVLTSGAVLLILGSLALFSGALSHVAVISWYVLWVGIGRGLLGVGMTAVQGRAFAGPHFGRITGLLDLGYGFGAFSGPWLTALGRDTLGTYVPGLASAMLAASIIAVCATQAWRRSGSPVAQSRTMAGDAGT